MKTSKLLLGIVWLHMALAAQAVAAGVGVNNAAAPMANADVMLEKNVLTLKGIVDPRLYVWVKSVYRPMDYSNQEECTRYNLITEGRKGLLDYEGFKHGHTLGSKWRPLPDKTLKNIIVSPAVAKLLVLRPISKVLIVRTLPVYPNRPTQ